jgi:hypothetical protein
MRRHSERCLASSASTDAWLSCPVARCNFLPRSDSDGLSTRVGACHSLKFICTVHTHINDIK